MGGGEGGKNETFSIKSLYQSVEHGGDSSFLDKVIWNF